MLWYGILAALFAIEIVMIALLRWRRKDRSGRTGKPWLCPVIALAVCAALAVWSPANALIALLHLCVFLCVGILADGICLLVSRGKDGGTNDGSAKDSSATEESRKRVRESSSHVWFAAAVACIVWLGIGWYAAHHIWRTDYSLTTDKSLGQEKLRIVQISDTHIGVTMDAEDFAKALGRIAEEKPDIIVVTGDFTDENTSREDMVKCCQALGQQKTRYGVYFVFGNHDASDEGEREFTSAELEAELGGNGVVVMRDKVLCVEGKFYLVGRRDTSESRASYAELAKGLDPSKYVIVLDHQPGDFTKEAAAGADLVLAGHTHGGQMIPLGLASQFLPTVFGDAEFMYGMRMYGDTACVVSSGMSSWEFVIKTGTISEFTVVDVCGK